MTSADHGGQDHLAPVTPLFSRRDAIPEQAPRVVRGARGADFSASAPRARDEGVGESRGVRFRDADDSVLSHARSSGGPTAAADDGTTDADGWWVDDADATPGATLAGAERPTRARHAPEAADLTQDRHRECGGFPSRTRTGAEKPADDARSAPTTPSRPRLVRASDLLAGDQAQTIDLPRLAAGTPARPVTLRAVAFVEAADESTESRAEASARAEKALVRKLTGRGMSVSEARAYLRGQDLAVDVIDDTIDDFLARGYLDDAVLAEQLVHTAVTRKNQGRRAIAQALSARGIDRSEIDVALAELPDDDQDRALEFARGKAASLARLAPDVALRRLMGQLSRRGFPGNIAMTAAKAALAEHARPGVRFD